MLFLTSTSYAVRGLCELARQSPRGYVSVEDLVKGTELPTSFMTKVFRTLVQGGILKSSKGRHGGFALARQPAEITLLEVVQLFDGPNLLQQCVMGAQRCDPMFPCSQHRSYDPLRKLFREYLGRTTLADLVPGAAGQMTSV